MKLFISEFDLGGFITKRLEADELQELSVKICALYPGFDFSEADIEFLRLSSFNSFNFYYVALIFII